MTTDLRPELGRLRAPVLLIGAGKAFNSSASRLEEMRAAYENQVQNVLDRKILMAQKALHFIMFDDPEFLFRSIDEFLAERR
jgi:pimeloyl-ACP methyl ester carboxylesterase